MFLPTDEEEMILHPMAAYHSRRDYDEELSTLPSPSSSVVDIDSNAGTVETEVLLSSYKGIHTSASGTQSLFISEMIFIFTDNIKAGKTGKPSFSFL